MCRRILLLISISVMAIVSASDKKKLVHCEKGSDCSALNLSPTPQGCMSLAGSQPVCFHLGNKKNDPIKNYLYNFDD